MDVLIDIGAAAHQILDRAASLPANLIVMGTHGTSGFEHLVLGSVTEKSVAESAVSGADRATEQSATARLKALTSDAVPDRCATTLRVVHGKSYVEILRIAAEDHADLIVTGVHGRNAIDLMLFGSTTNQLVRRATCPVLTLRQ